MPTFGWAGVCPELAPSVPMVAEPSRSGRRACRRVEGVEGIKEVETTIYIRPTFSKNRTAVRL